MTEIKQQLFDAFRADHVMLGSGFYNLATCLRNNDIGGAKAVAAKIGIEAGPHIAFEEEVFYPALKNFLSDTEIEAMYREHENGRLLLEKIIKLDEAAELSGNSKQMLLKEVENYESHISECGELFGVMGSLSESDSKQLLEKLKSYRLDAANWISRTYSSEDNKNLVS